MFIIKTAFQKVVTKVAECLTIFCCIKGVVCCHSANYQTINKISLIFLNKLIMENYGHT